MTIMRELGKKRMTVTVGLFVATVAMLFSTPSMAQQNRGPGQQNRARAAAGATATGPVAGQRGPGGQNQQPRMAGGAPNQQQRQNAPNFAPAPVFSPPGFVAAGGGGGGSAGGCSPNDIIIPLSTLINTNDQNLQIRLSLLEQQISVLQAQISGMTGGTMPGMMGPQQTILPPNKEAQAIQLAEMTWNAQITPDANLHRQLMNNVLAFQNSLPLRVQQRAEEFLRPQIEANSMILQQARIARGETQWF